MENKDPTTESEQPEAVTSPESSPEPIKTKEVVEEEPSKIDASKTQSSKDKKPTQNGEIEPKITENGEEKTESGEELKVESNTEPETESDEKLEHNDKSEDNDKFEDNKSEDSDKPADSDKHVGKPEDRPTRTTRGTKRKANESERSESTNDSSNNETTEQKENVQNESDLKDDTPLKSFSGSNIMGKGKRARIPNKRYSDILLSPNRKSGGHPKSLDITEPEIAIKIKDEPLDSPVASAVSSPSLPSKKNRALPKENLQDPKYLKPFKYGWKRELVWRSTSTQTKRMGDIYYYTPTGKKVRSFREVSDQLHNKNLTLDNFSFVKEPLGVDDPEKEIIRDAKIAKSSDSFTESPVPALKKLEIRKPKKLMSPKSGGAESPKVEKPEPVVAVTATPGKRRAAAAGVASVVEKEKEIVKETPPSASKKTAKMPVKKGRTPVAKKPKLSVKTEEPMEVETPPPPRPSPGKTSKPCQPCSIRCDGLQGIVPTLQCHVCLCLYHHECVGLSPIMMYPYVCKNCQNQDQTTAIVSPPPLTPINSLKSATISGSIALPKLQRIPRPDSSDPVPVLQSLQVMPSLVGKEPSHTSGRPEMPTLTPKPPQLQDSQAEPRKSLVGSVTSWLPHNVKIVNSEEPTEAPRPQYVEYLAGRKFLVIPKHNFMSVSSSNSLPQSESLIHTSAALQPTAVPSSSASLGPNFSSSCPDTPQAPSSPKEAPSKPSEEVPEIKKEPLSPVKEDEQEHSNPMDVDAIETKKEKDDTVDGSSQAQEGSNDGDDEASQNAQVAQSKTKKRNLKLKSITHSKEPAVSEEKNEAKFMENYLQNLSFGYNTLLYVFQYLKVQDLLRAGCVCTMWRDIASHPILWRTVRMKNSQVHSFEGLANTLKKHGTVHLDLRKMLLPSNGDQIWPEFSKAIARVDTLRKIEFCRCPATVVEQLAVSNPNLKVINAVTIMCESMNLDSFSSLNCIQELRLKSTCGLNINSIDSLKELKTLKILSLTSVNELHKLDLNVIAQLSNLECLDLGECTEFPKNFGQDILVKLEKLEKLRLEKGQGNCHTFEILEAVKAMKSLEQLELVNFDVKSGFDKALGSCTNIKKLMVIPTYISQSATTNNMVLSGVLRLQGSLTHFVWGVTLELLRVTELFVDQCEDSNKKEKKPTGNGDSIPVLKPVPDLSNGGAIQAASNPPQVEILPLPNLQKLLLNSLPTTRVKILKIPFHATWRQTLTDSV